MNTYIVNIFWVLFLIFAPSTHAQQDVSGCYLETYGCEVGADCTEDLYFASHYTASYNTFPSIDDATAYPGQNWLIFDRNYEYCTVRIGKDSNSETGAINLIQIQRYLRPSDVLYADIQSVWGEKNMKTQRGASSLSMCWVETGTPKYNYGSLDWIPLEKKRVFEHTLFEDQKVVTGGAFFEYTIYNGEHGNLSNPALYEDLHQANSIILGHTVENNQLYYTMTIDDKKTWKFKVLLNDLNDETNP